MDTNYHSWAVAAGCTDPAGSCRQHHRSRWQAIEYAAMSFDRIVARLRWVSYAYQLNTAACAAGCMLLGMARDHMYMYTISCLEDKYHLQVGQAS